MQGEGKNQGAVEGAAEGFKDGKEIVENKFTDNKFGENLPFNPGLSGGLAHAGPAGHREPAGRDRAGAAGAARGVWGELEPASWPTAGEPFIGERRAAPAGVGRGRAGAERPPRPDGVRVGPGQAGLRQPAAELSRPDPAVVAPTVAILAHRGDVAAVALATLLRRHRRCRVSAGLRPGTWPRAPGRAPPQQWVGTRWSRRPRSRRLTGDAGTLPDGSWMDAGDRGRGVPDRHDGPGPAIRPGPAGLAEAEAFALALSWLAGLGDAVGQPAQPDRGSPVPSSTCWGCSGWAAEAGLAVPDVELCVQRGPPAGQGRRAASGNGAGRGCPDQTCHYRARGSRPCPCPGPRPGPSRSNQRASRWCWGPRCTAPRTSAAPAGGAGRRQPG